MRSTFRSEHAKMHYMFALCTLPKVSRTWGCCSSCKNDGKRGTFEEALKRCILRGIRDVGRSGRWFPERGCILEHQICRFAKMIFHDRRSTSYDLALFFCGKRSTLDRWHGKITKRSGTRPAALHPTVHFEGSLAELLRFWRCQTQKLRGSGRIVSFLMMSSSTHQEVSQTCFALDLSPSAFERSRAESFQTDRETERQTDR